MFAYSFINPIIYKPFTLPFSGVFWGMVSDKKIEEGSKITSKDRTKKGQKGFSL